ncbi:MAG: hypothetical protein A3F40_01890 [Chlamydiae bacterium RIFCSPHIGHO2_12_FULL_27_8]|nr:MAG: hypothetical protein A3F40_01890 [Chlamydiae bacterium RIFCSPHIGHO2_12_FULL_27_8]
MMNVFLLVFLLFVLIGFSAIFSASETSLFSLSSFTIKTYKESNIARKKKIAKLLSKPRDLLVTILILNITANILIQNTVSSIFGNISSWVLKVGVPLILTLLFGEVIPKSLALTNNKKVANFVSGFIAFVFILIKPVRIFLTKITSYISRLMFFFLKKEHPLNIDELKHVIKETKNSNILSDEEKELIQGYLHLNSSSLKENLRPKDEIIFYDINKPITELIDLFVNKELSRVPICDKQIDNILGILSLKRFFLNFEKIKEARDLKDFLKKPLFVPDSMNSYALLNKLRESRENIAIVVDEYGTVIGLITQEDLFENVIGKISDTKDIKQKYTFTSKDVIIASSKMTMEEINEIFNVDIENPTNAVTIGGFLIDKLKKIPQSGTKLVIDNLLFYVLASEPNRVRRVYIRKLKDNKRKKIE